jgi:putative nucleotidyltransferase with HDIG domain
MTSRQLTTLARVPDVPSARVLAESLLAAELPVRWIHTQAVAAQARTLRPVLGADTEVVESAAWLHDIGYAPALQRTGFHPLDGACYLRDLPFGDACLWTLVAHHSCASIEADERGLGDVLRSEFPATGDHAARLIAAITYCDMTAGSRGELVSVDARITDILDRYEQNDVVYRAVTTAAPQLREQAALVAAALSATS